MIVWEWWESSAEPSTWFAFWRAAKIHHAPSSWVNWKTNSRHPNVPGCKWCFVVISTEIYLVVYRPSPTVLWWMQWFPMRFLVLACYSVFLFRIWWSFPTSCLRKDCRFFVLNTAPLGNSSWTSSSTWFTACRTFGLPEPTSLIGDSWNIPWSVQWGKVGFFLTFDAHSFYFDNGTYYPRFSWILKLICIVQYANSNTSWLFSPFSIAFVSSDMLESMCLSHETSLIARYSHYMQKKDVVCFCVFFIDMCRSDKDPWRPMRTPWSTRWLLCWKNWKFSKSTGGTTHVMCNVPRLSSAKPTSPVFFRCANSCLFYKRVPMSPCVTCVCWSSGSTGTSLIIPHSPLFPRMNLWWSIFFRIDGLWYCLIILFQIFFVFARHKSLSLLYRLCWFAWIIGFDTCCWFVF